MNSRLLALIEQLFSERRDKEALDKVEQLALLVQLTWERESQQFRDGLTRINWWETLFSRTYPITYERLKQSPGRRVNATSLFRPKEDESTNVWRNLLVLIADSDRIDRGIWQTDALAIHPADEFGIDSIYILKGTRLRTIPFRNNGGKGHSSDFFSPALVSNKEAVMRPIKCWVVSFQQAVVVLLQHIKTGEQELVWVPMDTPLCHDFELSNWSINHNNLTENPEDFAAPPFLHGDSTLGVPLIAATEGRMDVVGKTALYAVTIRYRDTLLFDQVSQTKMKKKVHCWRALLTEELWEPKAIPVTSVCLVLDSFLLYASNDGVLRAHPRGNPKSTYHVEELQSLVPHMTSLYNVVALIHSHSTLEVRHVEKVATDPFLRFRVLFRDNMADQSHAPLLYGPYVFYASWDGSWYRVKYDSAGTDPVKEEVRVPFKAGWTIAAMKTVNWRYWNVVLKKNHQTEEYIMFAGGLPVADDKKPSFVAACIECGTRASHLCETCRQVGFCKKHGDGHAHLDDCSQ
jgi:hypothetical protein